MLVLAINIAAMKLLLTCLDIDAKINFYIPFGDISMLK